MKGFTTQDERSVSEEGDTADIPGYARSIFHCVDAVGQLGKLLSLLICSAILASVELHLYANEVNGMEVVGYVERFVGNLHRPP